CESTEGVCQILATPTVDDDSVPEFADDLLHHGASSYDHPEAPLNGFEELIGECELEIASEWRKEDDLEVILVDCVRDFGHRHGRDNSRALTESLRHCFKCGNDRAVAREH